MAMVAVGPDGAFSVNSVGLARAPFPLSFSVRATKGSWLVHATAAQAAELADVLMTVAGDTIVIVGLETNSFLDESYRPWRPSLIAAEQGVGYEAHDVGVLASGVVGLSDEALVIRRDDLPRFLAGWYPYELTMIDVPGAPTAGRLDEIILAVGTAGHDEPILLSLTGSRLFFSGHDDCYVAVESTDPSLPAAIMSRLLALLVGSALVDDSVVDVPDPDVEALESLIEESRHWVGVLGVTTRDAVTVDLHAVPEPWRLGEPPVPARVDRRAVYDITTGGWRLQDPVAPASARPAHPSRDTW
ncbi:hypothetical protein [Micromonospora musae]|uniref:hypothetical protein n=1 Tax=Micromonospora musae TaxID=1894970 RepID=UPI0011C4935B|nr:hypothetical protein [Micromonospora musae]